MSVTEALAVGTNTVLKRPIIPLGDVEQCVVDYYMDNMVNWQSPIGAAYQCVNNASTNYKNACVRRGTNGGSMNVSSVGPWFLAPREPNIFPSCMECQLACLNIE
jgi:hypothetical protein